MKIVRGFKSLKFELIDASIVGFSAGVSVTIAERIGILLQFCAFRLGLVLPRGSSWWNYQSGYFARLRSYSGALDLYVLCKASTCGSCAVGPHRARAHI